LSLHEPEGEKMTYKYLRKDPESGEITQQSLEKAVHNSVVFDKETGYASEVINHKPTHI